MSPGEVARSKRRQKKRVLMLCHEELVPQESIHGLTDEEIDDWRTEFDVLSTLRDLGHEAQALGLGDDVDAVRRTLLEYEPDVCFNLVVEFRGVHTYDQHVVSLLELLRQDYTGCNPRGLTLARDKALSKKVLAWDGLPVPDFAVFELGQAVERPAYLPFPLFVKSLDEEASLGISQKSIVTTEAQLVERVRFIHERVGTHAIAEDYIDGREFYVGLLGNDQPEVFPIWELCIPDLPEGAPRIATRRVKWDLAYQRKVGVRNRRADLAPEMEARIASVARASYRALGLTGYARLDIRMRPDGRFYVLEANPNPDLTYGEDFAESAEAGGVSYEELIERILDLGMSFPAAWKASAE